MKTRNKKKISIIISSHLSSSYRYKSSSKKNCVYATNNNTHGHGHGFIIKMLDKNSSMLKPCYWFDMCNQFLDLYFIYSIFFSVFVLFKLFKLTVYGLNA